MTTLAADRAIEIAESCPAQESSGRGVPNINPETGLSTDYLNHFTEAVMMLEMIAVMPDGLDDLKAWRPMTYCEHFAASRFSHRDAVIAAHATADPAVRERLDAASAALNGVLAQTLDAVIRSMPAPTAERTAQQALSRLKPLIARIAAVINGTDTGPAGRGDPQAAIDAMFGG